MEAELQNPNNLDEISIIKYDAIIQPVFVVKCWWQEISFSIKIK